MSNNSLEPTRNSARLGDLAENEPDKNEIGITENKIC